MPEKYEELSSNSIGKIYIAGKITDLDKQEVFDKFFNQERIFKELNIDCVNPLRVHGIHSMEDYINHIPKKWNEYLRKDIEELMKCDAIWLMPCWRTSDGAKLERIIAQGFKMKIFGYYE